MSLVLFHNAKFYSLKGDKIYDWLLSANGRIVSLGMKGDAPGENIKRIDLGQKTVIPAFTDAHTHFVATALYIKRVHLEKAASLKQALEILQQAEVNLKSGAWVYGGGYDKNLWKDGQPHKKYLDTIFSQNPVLLESKDCHAIWVNSLALKLAGINTNTPNPVGGRIGRDKNNQLSGIFYERAQGLIRRVLPKDAENGMAEAVENILNRFHSLGITSVHTMEGFSEFRALQYLALQKKLKMRVTIYLPQDGMEKIIQAGLQSGFGDEWLRLGGVKFFADGSLGSQTAELLQPYEGTENYGLANIPEDELDERISLATGNGLSVAVRAIGDKALLKVLKAFEKALAHSGKMVLPNRVEHAQLFPFSQIERFKKLGLIASVQPIHIADDVLIAERYWGKRAVDAYPFRNLLNQQIILAFGSDTPVAYFDPIQGIYSAVQRKYKLNSKASVWNHTQVLTVEEAVRAYTIGSAVAGGEFALKGTLEEGKLTDFVVLNKDLFTLPVEELLQVKVVRTVLNGKTVFEM